MLITLLLPKMKRKEVRICLLLAFIFITSGCYYFTAIRIRSAESAVDFKFKPVKARESSAAGFMTATWNKSGMQNNRKVPSAPNPIGNRHPPSRHN
ncbi:CLAVATA3/ESR (CLE)-related protein 46-like [Juglans microcarpa x Juglans regia]|uniref:CLAVATA3/ESR (CLE)-related protein 46-like n=1 Tax=Juglans microcarpa x Juglans regia TaxID=2249226 RepID=UPI001B7E9D4E|nr:CLAVATA3/ESR (CLE)-related protein 46-like [Juglans microcarpa x Juglans regia]